MTFAERLEVLRKAAEEAGWEGNADRAFTYFLYNNADAILELVRAAEVMVGHADGDDLEAELRAVEALAKLNGVQT